MSKIRTAALASLLWAFSAQGAKIQVDRERTINLGGKGDVFLLFDEQQIAGDPKAGTGGKPATEYTNGYINQALYYPLVSVVDLGAVHDLTDIWYYDVNGADSIHVWCGDGTAWTPMVAQTTSGWQSWVGKAVPCTGRYVKIRLRSPSSAVTEAVLYGTPKGSIEPLPAAAPHVKPTMGDLMGINGFIDDDRTLLQAVGNVREYHSWMWDDGNTDAGTPAWPNNRFGWNPSWVRGTGWGWNFDDYYADLSSKGMVMAPVFQGAPAWMFGKVTGDSLKPFPLGRDSTLAASYKEHADYLFQFAARYGRTKVPAGKLRVDAMNQPLSGLGSVAWMEPWNEPDKNWKGRTGYFDPQVLSAMSSADYDGDQGRLGADFGIKSADPTMKMALPGLIGIDREYVKAMKWWSDRNRAGSFPADALNFHHYCNDAGGQNGVATTGISPEQDDLRGRLEHLADWRDRWLAGKELWLSEFGWDTHPQSVFRARAVGGNDEYEMQGRWIVRAFLAVAASGFDKAQVFLLRDDWDSGPGTFVTSGLVHDKHDTLKAKFEKKSSWYYVNTLHKTLKDYRWVADESVGEMRVYRFAHATRTDSVAYAVWNQNDSTSARDVSVPTSMTSGREVRLSKGNALGVSAAASFSGGSLRLAAIDGRPRLVAGTAGSTSATRGTAMVGVSPDPERRIDGRRIPAVARPALSPRLEPLYGP